MIKKLRKKGFTIVELVIVIAVIAILAAILIPTFSGIIKKANIASDTAMAKNMNTALVMADSEGNTPEDMGDVLFILYEAGYILENLNPTTNGYYFAWDQPKNQIIFLTDTFEVHYSSEPYSEDTLNWWLPIDEASDVTEIEAIGAKVSYCMAADITGSLNFDYLANFDTNGFILTGDISYGTSGTAVNDLGSFSVSGIIVGTLFVNTPEATVSHYGAINYVNIFAVAETSYHEYGFVKVSLELQKGRLVIENTGNAREVSLPSATTGTTAENNGYIENLTTVENGVVLSGHDVGMIPTGFSILINNLSQLEAFRDAVNFGMRCDGLTVKLMADIDISNRFWKPIGLNNKHLTLRYDSNESPNESGKYSDGYTTNGPANVFRGIFDGNGKTINGLTNQGYVAPSTLYWVNAAKTNGYAFGLFSVTHNATIKNLNMTNVNIVSTEDSSACVGGIVGGVRGSFNLENCTVKGNIQGTDGVGGAVGYVYLIHTDSTPDQDIEKIVSFKNINVEANIHAKINGGDKGQRAGGIIGSALMYNIFAYDQTSKDGVITYKSTQNNEFHMTDCSFIGTVLADSNRAGGLFATSSGGKSGKSDIWITTSSKLLAEGQAKLIVKNNTVNATITSGDNRSARYFTADGGFSQNFTTTTFTELPVNSFTGKVFFNLSQEQTNFTGCNN